MTEQVQEALAEVDSAQAPEATAAPDTASTAPEVADEQLTEEKPASKTFTQEELDAAIGKRLAREQRKWEREQQAKLAEMQAKQAVPKDLPAVDQFESPEAYAEALALRKAEELLATREQQRQQAAILEAYHDKEEEARAKYDDFEQVAYNPQLRITDVMAQTIQASDIGPELAYHLGSNPKEADRISKLPPILQAKEIGKIEAKLASNPTIPKTTSAPSPITPVTARTSGSPSYDTTDPRSTKTMSASEWIEADRARQIRKLQAQMNR
jgi:type I site-specific restriction-modification system R (restriction) subunit